MKRMAVIVMLSLTAQTVHAEFARSGTFGFGLYGGSGNHAAVVTRDRSSLVSGTAEMTFGARVTENYSWHLALQSLSLQSSLHADEAMPYDGFRIGARYTRHFGRLNMIAGLGGGSVHQDRPYERYRASSFFSPELGISYSFYKSERVQWDLTFLNSFLFSEGLYDLPKSVLTSHVGISCTMALSSPYRPVNVYLGEGVVRGLGHLLQVGGRGGMVAARGMFTLIRGIR